MDFKVASPSWEKLCEEEISDSYLLTNAGRCVFAPVL